MSRRLSPLLAATAAVASLVSSASSAGAQPPPEPAPVPAPQEPAPEPARPPAQEPAPPDAGQAPAETAPAPTAQTVPPPPPSQPDEDELGDQAVSAELGLSAGGRVTPGGLRITGRYLYRLSDRDWFDGAASFTFGSGDGACFRDRQDDVICQHGLADGTGFELAASVRRMFAAQGAFQPFARLGLGLGVARFGDDDLSGFTIPLHAGAGVRVQVSSSIALLAGADLALGIGSFNRGLGLQPQLGFTVAAGVEFRLR